MPSDVRRDDPADPLDPVRRFRGRGSLGVDRPESGWLSQAAQGPASPPNLAHASCRRRDHRERAGSPARPAGPVSVAGGRDRSAPRRAVRAAMGRHRPGHGRSAHRVQLPRPSRLQKAQGHQDPPGPPTGHRPGHRRRAARAPPAGPESAGQRRPQALAHRIRFLQRPARRRTLEPGLGDPQVAQTAGSASTSRRCATTPPASCWPTESTCATQPRVWVTAAAEPRCATTPTGTGPP
jgi:hypothetical protein